MSDEPLSDEPPAPFSNPPRSGPDSGKGERSLKQKALRGSGWTIFGFGTTQFIRLAGNVIVTRLLVPEMFGIMALVWVVIYALSMLSDVGSGLQVVRHERGDEPDFLNTAWTMQVMRGVALFAVACLLAWPIGWIFAEPILFPLIAVVGFTSVIDGFTTMKMATATRHMALGRQTLVEMLSQMIGVVSMVVLAYLYTSIWALAAGTLITRIMRLILAEVMLPGIRNQFCWERQAVSDLFHFGKWVLSSSVLMLISKQVDKPVIGLLDSMAVLGIYDRAGRLSEPFQALSARLARKVVYPAMSSVHRNNPERMRQSFYRARLALDTAFLPLMGMLLLCAPILVSILYDERYAAAGWMLQILLLRVTVQCVLGPNLECLVAIGQPRYMFWLTLARTIWVIVGLPAGWYLGGLPGLILAMGLSGIPPLLIAWHGMYRYRILNVPREALAMILVGLGALAGWALSAYWSAELADHWLAFEAWLRAQWEARMS